MYTMNDENVSNHGKSVLLKWEKDFLTPLEEFVYSKQKTFEDKTCVHQ